MHNSFQTLLQRATRVRVLLDAERKRHAPSWLQLVRLQRLHLILKQRMTAMQTVPVPARHRAPHFRAPAFS